MFGVLTVVLCLLQLSRAIQVYLSPPPSLPRYFFSPEDASALLSHHLGLEMLEPFRDATASFLSETSFVGKGPKKAIVLVLDEKDAKSILPPSFRPSFKVLSPASVSSLSSIVSTYMHQASHVYSSIYEPRHSTWYPSEIKSLSSFFESKDSGFAALDLSELSDVHLSKKDYDQAVTTVRSFLEEALQNSETMQVAVLTYRPSSVPTKRQTEPEESQSPLPPARPPPQQPIGSISTCYTSADECNRNTSICSGHGQCVEASKDGRSCFICMCSVTKTGEGSKVKTEKWVGESCERKDISGPFVLFTGTAIVMILLIVGSVSLLYTVGNQELPSTLMGGAVHAKKD